MIRRHVISLLVIAALAVSGCAAVVAGGAAAGGTYAYVAGWLERDYNVSLDRAYPASVSAVEGLKLTLVSKEKELAGAQIKAKDADADVWIKLESKSKDVTTIKVRHGLLGDEEASKRIHEAIAARL